MENISGSPLVSVVTVNYDQPEVTCALIESLRHISYPSIEIIVVDNGSPTKDPSMIPLQYPEVIFIKSDLNLGFAGGNNLGIHVAKGKYLLLINNDTEVEPGFLEPLVKKLEEDPDIGVVSPKIRYFYHPNIIQFAGFTTINPFTIRHFSIGFNEIDHGQYDKDSLTNYAFGAAMMLPMDAVRKVGLMADIFFLYYEELDWIQRIKDAGYKVWYVHNSLVYHKDSISTGSMSPLKIYYLSRNRILYLRRNIKGWVAAISILYQIFIAIPKNAGLFLFKGQIKLFTAYLKAINWHIKTIFSKSVHESPRLS